MSILSPQKFDSNLDCGLKMWVTTQGNVPVERTVNKVRKNFSSRFLKFQAKFYPSMAQNSMELEFIQTCCVIIAYFLFYLFRL